MCRDALIEKKVELEAQLWQLIRDKVVYCMLNLCVILCIVV